MRIFVMLAIIMMLLSAADIGAGLRVQCGYRKQTAVFFCLCMLTLGMFEYSPIPEVSVSPACILMPLWLGAASAKEYTSKSLLMIPIGIACAALAAIPIIAEINGAIYLAGIAIALTAIVASPLSAMATAAFLPIIVAVVRFAYELYCFGYARFEVSTDILSIQLVGVIAAFFIETIKLSMKTAKKSIKA